MPFVPTKKVTKNLLRNIKIEVPPEKYEELQSLAQKHNISLKEFIRQCVDYATSNM